MTWTFPIEFHLMR